MSRSQRRLGLEVGRQRQCDLHRHRGADLLVLNPFRGMEITTPVYS